VAGLNAAEQAALSRGLHDANAKCAAALSELDVARERSERIAKEVGSRAHCYDHFFVCQLRPMACGTLDLYACWWESDVSTLHVYVTTHSMHL